MRTNLDELKKFLHVEFDNRRASKASYSKRAFARDLKLSSTALNEFLAGKRDLSFKNIDRIFQYLNKKVHCSWCDKAQKEVNYLVGGPRRQFICDKCITICVELAESGKLKS